MKSFISMRMKMIFFGSIVLLFSFGILEFGISSMNQIVRSSRLVQEDYIPIMNTVNFASLALCEGQLLMYQVLEDVKSPNEYDDVRIFESRFKKTMINFDMYIKAAILGSESLAFRKSSGGLTQKMWIRKKLQGKLVVKQAPLEIRQFLGKASLNYKEFVNHTLAEMKNLKKALRLELKGQIEEANLERVKLKEHKDKAKKSGNHIGEIFREINTELEVYLLNTSSTIEKTHVQARTMSSVLFVVLFLIIALFIIVFLEKHIIRPLQAITKATRSLGKGKIGLKIDFKSDDELGQLVDSFNQMSADLRKTTVSRNDLIQEVAEHRKTEEALKMSHKELKETTMQIIQSEKLAAIGEIAAGVAHELKQPLNVTKIISQSLVRDVEKDRLDIQEVKEDFLEVTKQMDRMAQIIDHMRVFSRQTTGEVKDVVDINHIVEDAFVFLKAQLNAHNILVTKTFGADLPKIQVDAIRIEQVLMNLITNARHALESSGKGEKRIDITTLMDTNRKSVIVEVKDNGDGVPEDLKEKIFESFFTTKEIGKGTGLGLSVSQKIIEEHKGSIELDSVHGQGATFRVFLPVLEMKLRT